MNDKSQLVDIFKTRKNSSDLWWIFKDYESKISYFNNYKSNEYVKQAVLDSMNFKYDLKLISDKNSKSESELLSESVKILDNMRHHIGMNSIRLMGYILSKIARRLYGQIFVNKKRLELLKDRLSNDGTVAVLLPTHRSYADFLLMSFALFECDFPLPVIAAAADFQKMSGVGQLLRHCGAFFIRRKFADDNLYWSVFSNYIKSLIGLAQEPLEFFIEGTRSRTNKSLYPRIGLLGVVLEHWLSTASDVVLVPISISYDRVLEETLYSWELLGVPKPAESTSGLLKVRHILDDNYGNIYMNIGEAISISDLAETCGIARFHHNLQLRFKPSLFTHERRFVQAVALLVVERQQQQLVLTDWSILSLVLMHAALYEDLSLGSDTKGELEQRYSALCALLRQPLNAQLAADCCEPVDASAQISAALHMHRAMLEQPQPPSNDTKTHPIILRGCKSFGQSEPKLADFVERIRLGICRNPLLFHLARESVLLLRISHGSLNNQSVVMNDFNEVLGLLSREFVYFGGFANDSFFQATLDKLKSCDLLRVIGNSLQPNKDHACFHIVQSAVELHLYAYAFYGRIVYRGEGPLIETNSTELCKFIQKSAIKFCSTNLKFGYKYMEMCSLDMIRNAVSRFRDILRQSPKGLETTVHIIESCLSQDVRDQLSRNSYLSEN